MLCVFFVPLSMIVRLRLGLGLGSVLLVMCGFSTRRVNLLPIFHCANGKLPIGIDVERDVNMCQIIKKKTKCVVNLYNKHENAPET